MNRTQLFKKIRGFSRVKLRELSKEQSCLAYSGGEPNAHAHKRLMFCSGFRKGIKAGLRGERGVGRAISRTARGRYDDAAWALGFARGVKYTPDVDLESRRKRVVPKAKFKPIGNEFVYFDASQLSKSDLRRLKKRGRA